MSILRRAREEIWICSDESRVGESGGGWPKPPPAPANVRCNLSIPDIQGVFLSLSLSLFSEFSFLWPVLKINGLMFCVSANRDIWARPVLNSFIADLGPNIGTWGFFLGHDRALKRPKWPTNSKIVSI